MDVIVLESIDTPASYAVARAMAGMGCRWLKHTRALWDSRGPWVEWESPPEPGDTRKGVANDSYESMSVNVASWWQALEGLRETQNPVVVCGGPFVTPHLFLQTDVERERMIQALIVKELGGSVAISVSPERLQETTRVVRDKYPGLTRAYALQLIERQNLAARLRLPTVRIFHVILTPGTFTATDEQSLVWRRRLETWECISGVTVVQMEDEMLDERLKVGGFWSIASVGEQVANHQTAAYALRAYYATRDVLVSCVKEFSLDEAHGVFMPHSVVRGVEAPALTALVNIPPAVLRRTLGVARGNPNAPMSPVPLAVWIEGAHGIGKSTVVDALRVLDAGTCMDENYVESAPTDRGTLAAELHGAEDRLARMYDLIKYGVATDAHGVVKREGDDLLRKNMTNQEQAMLDCKRRSPYHRVYWFDRSPLTNVMYLSPESGARVLRGEPIMELILGRVREHPHVQVLPILLRVDCDYETLVRTRALLARLTETEDRGGGASEKEKLKRLVLATPNGLAEERWWEEVSVRYTVEEPFANITSDIWVCVDDMTPQQYEQIHTIPYPRDTAGRFVHVPDSFVYSTPGGCIPYFMCANIDLARGAVPGEIKENMSMLVVSPVDSKWRIARMLCEWVTGRVPDELYERAEEDWEAEDAALSAWTTRWKRRLDGRETSFIKSQFPQEGTSSGVQLQVIVDDPNPGLEALTSESIRDGGEELEKMRDMVARRRLGVRRKGVPMGYVFGKGQTSKPLPDELVKKDE